MKTCQKPNVTLPFDIKPTVCNRPQWYFICHLCMYVHKLPPFGYKGNMKHISLKNNNYASKYEKWNTNKHTNTSNYAQRICTKYILMNQHMIIFAVSTFTKGEQMVPVLNKLGVHCAVYGNHDFGRWTFLFVFVFIVICIWLAWLFVWVFVFVICICSICSVWHCTTVGSTALNVTTICFAAELCFPF